jgi:DNA-binding transcriptional regulator YiaG
MRPDKIRFWEKVDIRDPDECWEWKGCKLASGYGRFNVLGQIKLAHRVALMISGVQVNDSLVLHKCDNKGCVNPNHLYLGTSGDNIGDREKRNPVSGELSGVSHTKLYAEEMVYIRSQRYKLTQSQLAERFRVSRTTIRRVWEGKSLCKEGYYA